MGFWQGVNEGLTFVMEADARKKEIEQARQDREAERKSELEIRRAEYAQSRKDTIADRDSANKQRLQELMFGSMTAAEKERADAQRLTAPAFALLQRFGGIKDPKIDALAADPAAAAAIEEEIRALEKSTFSTGGPPIPTSGKELLQWIVATSTGPVSVLPKPEVNMQPATYEEAATGVAAIESWATNRPTVTARLNPALYSKPNTENMKVARTTVEQEVMKQATAELAAVAGNATADADLRTAIGQFKDPNSEGYATLMTKYGQTAFNIVASNGDAFSVAAMQDPGFVNFSTARLQDIETANQYINDPNSTPEEVAMAKELLKKAYGENYGG